MVSDARQPRDDRGDPRQGPQIGAKPLRRRARPERPFHGRQGVDVQLRLAASPARALQPRTASGLPRVVPVVRTDPAHPKLLGHRRLRGAAREQPRGLQPACFQRGKISSRSGHASACAGTRGIR